MRKLNCVLRKNVFCALIFVFFSLSVSVKANEDVNDPFEPVNRKIFYFNYKLDQYLLTPLAKSYRFITPNIVEVGIGNFFLNLREPINALNSLLQGEPEIAAKSLARFVFNSTIGLYGLVDIMTPLGLPSKPEDFSQTLSGWNIDSGPYVVMPLLGPSDLRGIAGKIIDSQLDPLEWSGVPHKADLFILNGIQTRATFLGVEPRIGGDQYILMRSAYFSRRAYRESDGVVVDLFLDDPFDSDE